MIIIISGGQTGVDRGALDAALAMGTPCGGWCPEGRMADDGIIADKYPLQELAGAGYRQRTRQNVADSDATLIIYFDFIAPKRGTELTLLTAIKLEKPYLLIDGSDLSVERAANKILTFCQKHQISRLNVAGPSARHLPNARAYTQEVIMLLLQKWQQYFS